MSTRALTVCLLALALAGPGCGVDPATTDPAEAATGRDEQAFTSAEAVLLDFDFDGEVYSTTSTNAKTQVGSQLMYTVGHLNAEPGVSQLPKLTLTNVSTSSSGGLVRIRYHAKLPVAWGRPGDRPTSYNFRLPRRVDATGRRTFLARYSQVCNEAGDHQVTESNFWFHYRPHTPGCSLALGDVVSLTASVTVSALNTTGKYPEYHKVWEDGSLDVVALFAKYEAGATTAADVGIDAFNQFVAAVRAAYPGAATTPANVPAIPGIAYPDITFKVTRANGTRATIVAILIDSVTAAGSAFDKRYSELTPRADLILYNGHAGLGANIRSLMQKGKFFPGKYQVLFLNGCDTFAYVDDTLATTRAALNADDPTGTKYMEIVTNAMPAYFSSLSDASMALIGAFDDPSNPATYQEMFEGVDGVQVVVVTGEEDNRFTPSYDPGVTWNGIEGAGEVGYAQTQSYQTETLPPGTYVLTLTHDQASRGGDADLRYRLNSATATATKCPSYSKNSNERCLIRLTAAAKLYLSVTGDTSSQRSRYLLDGFELPH